MDNTEKALDESVVNAPEAGAQASASTKPNQHDCEVGYRKPPKAHQFKKGQSGNRKGRPKLEPIQDLRIVVDSVLEEPVTMRDGDQVRTMSTMEAIVEKLRLKALRGDPKAIPQLLKRARKAGLLSRSDSSPGVTIYDPWKGDQAKILRGLKAAKAARSMQQDSKTPSADADGGPRTLH